MSSQEWRELYRIIRRVARRQARPVRRPKFSDALILGMHFWAVSHDRPQCWACQRSQYHRPFLPRRLPSVSQFNRRIHSARCQAMLRAIEQESRAADAPCNIALLDGRPLPVGACSKDRQAHAGRVYGGFARGYRLHACLSTNGYFLGWSVTSLREAEKCVARGLLAEIRPNGLVLADGNYDVWYLYENVARYGGQLLATPRRGAGRGHRRPHPDRRIALNLWQSHGAWASKQRKPIERFFGQHSSYGGGLGPLPAWVRTLPRVQRWVQAKIILYHIRLTQRKSAREAG